MERFNNLASCRENLLDAIEAAEMEMMEAWSAAMDAAGTARGASLAAEHHRKTAAYTAALEDLDSWMQSPDGREYEELDRIHGGIYKTNS